MNLRSLFQCDVLSVNEKEEYYVLKNRIEDILYIEPEDIDYLVNDDEILDVMREKLADEVLSLNSAQKKTFSHYFDNAMRDIRDAYLYQLDALKIHDVDDGSFHAAVRYDIAKRMNKSIKLYLDDIAIVAISVQYDKCEPTMGLS